MINVNPSVIAFTGTTGSGKDTLARHLVDEFGITRLSFGDQIRHKADLTWASELKVNIPDHPYGSVDRDDWERRTAYKEYMQTFATRELIRDPYAFIMPVLTQIYRLNTTGVVTDLRSPLELHCLQQVADVWVIRVVRPNNPYRPGNLDCELNGHKFPELTNCGTPAYLTRGAEYITKTLRRLPYTV